ncbi:uncharacterized protein Ecym_7291 [Eremothecium cymbalariae DBVPG|uniref:Superoxide dismutase copper/zinc binding domain-containing protein n=1 Tax=Eremothecium cymbalariae (strain CBS 270.75 / DBVPG 7215 / KCTC 17166 / NRRL Y-17582) TaxID=931890 RepID=G8JWB4_ERECY|nr:hypothetical protein Ecym_7291 [Eremothecium cymbalariae DBVPG\
MKTANVLTAFAASTAFSTNPVNAFIANGAGAPMVDDNPKDACFVAEFPQGGSDKIAGYITFTSYEGIAKVSVELASIINPEDGFSYHIHEKALESADDCVCYATGEELNPFNGISSCADVQDKSLCKVGDLSGKYGFINSNLYQAKYLDPYLGLYGASPSFIGDRSIAIHKSDGSRVACADIVPCSEKKTGATECTLPPVEESPVETPCPEATPEPVEPPKEPELIPEKPPVKEPEQEQEPEKPKEKPKDEKTPEPPAPEEKPSAPEEKPSAPEEKPPAPEEKPPAPEEKPPAPEEKPPAPEEKPAKEKPTKEKAPEVPVAIPTPEAAAPAPAPSAAPAPSPVAPAPAPVIPAREAVVSEAPVTSAVEDAKVEPTAKSISTGSALPGKHNSGVYHNSSSSASATASSKKTLAVSQSVNGGAYITNGITFGGIIMFILSLLA